MEQPAGEAGGGLEGLAKIGLGGGCHWCTEGIFVSLEGVERVDQGWISSVAPDDAPAEAVIVHYRPRIVSARDLILVHLETHSATVDHPMRGKYRSAVYAFSKSDEERFAGILRDAVADFDRPVLTRVLPFGAFRWSLPRHRDYYRRGPELPFCRRYISPRLDHLRRRRPELFTTAN